MPVVIAEDAETQTIQTDDGRTVVVAKSFADPLGIGAPALEGQALPEEGPPPDPLAPLPLPNGQASPAPGTEAQPTEAPGMPAPETLSAPAAAPQPGASDIPAPAAAAAPPPVELPQLPIPRTPTEAAQQGLQGMEQEAQAQSEVNQTQAAGLEQQAQVQAQADQRIQQQEVLRHQYQAYRAKEEAQLLADKSALVERYANFRVDRNRRFKEMGTARTTWAWISVALAELGAALGGKQTGQAVGMLMNELDKDVQLQMADRDAIGTSIGMKAQEIADFRSVSATRAAEYNTRMAAHLAHAEREIQRIATRTQSQVLKQNAKLLSAQLQQERAALLGNAVTADRAFNEQRRARQAAAAEARRSRDAEMLTKGFVPDPNAPGGYRAIPPDPNAPMDDDARYKRARADKEEAEARLKGQQATAGPGGVPGSVGDPNRGGEPILQKDGSAWVPPTEKEQIQFRAAVPATANVRRIADKLKLAMDKYGGSSELVGSPEYQEVYALARTLDMEQKDIWGLGVIQGRDLEILEAIRGGKDPTSFIYDAAPQIQKTAETLEQRMLTSMRGGGFTGDWRPARVSEVEATELTPEENVQRLTRPASSAARQDSAAGKATRAKELEERKAAVPALLRTKPSIEKLSDWGRKVDKLREEGALTPAEALDVMNQAAPRALSEWKAKIQSMSPAQLAKAQQDPEFFRRATLLTLLESGSARPEEVYRLVIGQ